MDKQLNKEKINCVLYHGSCKDGFGSAMIVKQFLGDRQADYVPCYYGTDASKYLHKVKGKNVIMCDFHLPSNELMKLIDSANTFMILDHHKTTERDLVNISDRLKRVDMSKSGVGLTWEYLYGDLPMPKLYQLIQDRDLWLYKMEETRYLHCYLTSIKEDFNLWLPLLDNLDSAISEGRLIFEQESRLVDIISDTCTIVNHGTYRVAYVYCSLYKSEVGEAVLAKYKDIDFCALYEYFSGKNITVFSLRSVGDRDVSTICEKFGGGGHKNAAGMSVNGFSSIIPLKVIDRVELTSDKQIDLTPNQIKTLLSRCFGVLHNIEGKLYEVCYINSFMYSYNIRQRIEIERPATDVIVVWDCNMTHTIVYNRTGVDLNNISNTIVLEYERLDNLRRNFLRDIIKDSTTSDDLTDMEMEYVKRRTE